MPIGQNRPNRMKTMKLNRKKAKNIAKVPRLLADNPYRETLITDHQSL
jgi:hypothetical protein